MLRTGVGSRSCRQASVSWTRRGLAATLATSLLTWVGMAPASAAPTTLSWNYAGPNGVVGIPQFWTVPPEVYSATFTVFGAQGGAAVPGGTPGGLGGEATATVAVSPGEVLLIDVGGQPGGPVTGPAASPYFLGGFNGGGDGGSGGSLSFVLLTVFGIQFGYGGAGGGASGVYSAPYGPANALVVAGGGGGVGSLESAGGAGGGGASASQDTLDPLTCNDFNPCMYATMPGAPGGAPNIGLPLGGGVPGANGAGLTVSVPENAGGVNGSCVPGSSSGTGGDVGDECIGYESFSPLAGGGGGGGYYGGGGGEAYYSAPYGDGGFGGGGGSSYGPPGASFTPGVESGNGFVAVTYTPDAPVPPTELANGDVRPIAIAGSGSATVAFAAPRVGLPVTRYRVTAYPVGSGAKDRGDVLQATGSRTPITVNGLTDGTTYAFRVSATNVRGTGALSPPSSPVTPAPLPAAPTKVAAIAGGRLAVVKFEPVESPRGAPITSYTVVASPGVAHSTAHRSLIVVAGLTSGTTYTFKVYATNRIGSSRPGVSNPVTVAGPPATPTNAVATAGDGAATVAFDAPASTNRAPVSRYTVTASPGGEQATRTTSPITVTGLTNGTSYRFVVAATNIFGTSLPSPESNAVTPAPPTTTTTPPTRLDPNADSPASLAAGPGGAVYLTWLRKGNPDGDMFCKIPAGGTCTSPIRLALPGSTPEDETDQSFPVVAPNGAVYVVAGRYIRNDVVVWASKNAGTSFGAPMVVPSGSFTGMTNVDDVVLSSRTYAGESGQANDSFLMASEHLGLGFGLVGASQTSGTTSFAFQSSKGTDLSDVNESSLAVDPHGDPVESFVLQTTRIGFYRYAGSGPITSASSWEGPTLVTDGYLARLAGGPAGLFLLSQDRPPTGSGQLYVDIRKYDPATAIFGAPTTLAHVPPSTEYDGGALYEDPVTGEVVVAWPGDAGAGPAGGAVWTSSDGGSVWSGPISLSGSSPIVSGPIALEGPPGGYALFDNARLLLTTSGQAYVTYRDAGGLEVANLGKIGEGTPKDR